ncbi:hypothetical protein FIV00_26155 [Labrenzia sp. THAF82]|nr:hypothetical protein FIV00_26155 [Labrenzia sp. THAF82]
MLTGCAGNDAFVFIDTSSANDTTITDFTSGEDVIDLTAFGWEVTSNARYSKRDTDDGLLLNLENGSSILLVGVATPEITAEDIIIEARIAK